MRTIAGAQLIVAASVCLAAGLLVQATRISDRPQSQYVGYAGAAVLGFFGLILLLAGLSSDRRP
jgi:hypothetical protein